jgi:signal transduction histidine kinase
MSKFIQQTDMSIIIALFFLSLLILFIIFYRLSVNKRNLAEQQIRVAEQKINQLEQEKQEIEAQSALKSETEERTRLARDLHDGLGGMLSIIKINLENTEHIQNAREVLDKSIEELRRVSHHLMPASLLHIGLKASLEDFSLSIPNAQFDYFGNESRLADQIELLIYRCAYELVNNALKYAHATTIYIQLVQDIDHISLIVHDDGCGFDMETIKGGMGIENLRTRITAFNGNMNILSAPGKGTEARIELKIEN